MKIYTTRILLQDELGVVLYNYFILFIYFFFFYIITWTKRSVHGFGIELKKNEDFGNFAWESAFTIRQAKHHVYVKRQRRICTT